ncbi:MAG: TIR domain-containing protein, partial [Promethearchaeota archaeon]
KGHTSWVLSVCYSPDGKYIASGSSDKTIKVWEAASGHLVTTLKGHSSSVYSVCYSPDGKYIASGSSDNTIKIWEAASGHLVTTLKGHPSLVWSVCYSPDGKYIVSGSRDKTIKVWEAASGHLVTTLKGHTSRVNSVCYSPEGKYIASNSDDNTIKVWDIEEKKVVASYEHYSSVNSVAFSRDGKYLMGGDKYGDVLVWQVPMGDMGAVELKRSEVKKVHVRLMMMGMMNSGKTTLINGIMQYLGMSVNAGTIISTLGTEVRIVPGKENVLFWDFGGQKRYRLVHNMYLMGFDSRDLAIMVIDGIRIGEEWSAIKRDILSWLGMLYGGNTNVANLKIFFVLNKKDDKELYNFNKAVVEDDLRSLMARYDIGTEGLKIFETSAKKGDGIDELWNATDATLKAINSSGEVFLSEADYSFIDRELAKERATNGKLGIRFKEFLNGIHGNMESEGITEEDVRLYLRHISAGGEIILASKFGSDVEYIILRPILFSKIISYFSEVAYKNGGRVSFSGQFIDELLGKISNDPYIKEQVKEKGFELSLQRLKDYINESAEIAYDLNICTKDEQGSLLFSIYLNTTDKITEISKYVGSRKLLFTDYFITRTEPLSAHTILQSTLLNKRGFHLSTLVNFENPKMNWHISGLKGNLKGDKSSREEFFILIESRELKIKDMPDYYLVGTRIYIDNQNGTNMEGNNISQSAKDVLYELLGLADMLWTVGLSEVILIDESYIFCLGCGEFIFDDVQRGKKFCGNCGQKLPEFKYENIIGKETIITPSVIVATLRGQPMESGIEDRVKESHNRITVFISYADIDKEIFKIGYIANELRAMPLIKEVLFWEDSSIGRTDEFMERVEESDIFIVFCSPNSLKSSPVQDELRMALESHKPIIPVFVKLDHVFNAIKNERGLKIDIFNIGVSIKPLHDLVMTKLGIKKRIGEPIPLAVQNPHELIYKYKMGRIN